jgi:hypothetical protein
MGSPESEPERAYNEIQHQVTLTKGYWLADTTVTQAQWQAVTGESPSNFKGESLPVEEVSWSDSQKFIEMLRQDHPSIAFQLPSEAQWEYACRAGTATPFSFGEKITSEQANYDGNHPYDSGKKGEHRKTTVPVKSLPCNEWGLYEMHGNVEEWCNDSWQEKLVAGAVIDPESNEWSKLKVLRGGSWDIGGKYARSACRLHGSTYGTSSGSGLRLSFAPPSRNLGGGAAKTTNFKLKKENQVNLFIMCSQKDDVFKSALESRLRRVKQNYSLDFWSSTEFEKDGDVTSITHKDSTNADILILLISENSNTYKLFKSGIQQALKPFSDKIVIPIILDKSERWNNLNLSSMYLTPSEAIRESHDNISPVFWDEVEKSIELSVKNLLSKKSKPSNFA